MKHGILVVLSLLFIQILIACSDDSGGTDVQTELKLSNDELTLNVGEQAVLTVTEAPDVSETLVWSSDDKTVASVFQGTITALQSGMATITATYGDFTAECVVIVPEREYELVWSDEFDGEDVNTDNWSFEIGTGDWGWGNNEKQYYTDRSENVRIEDGMLVIEAIKEDYDGSDYTSARLITKNKQQFTYGKIEARLKVPEGRGTWPAFWMLGTTGGWPDAGEIDIMEHVGYDPNKFHHALHTKNKNGVNGQNAHAEYDLGEKVANEFHVITLEWVQDEIQGNDRMHFYIDGVKSNTFGETPQLATSGDWPFNTPFYFIVNLAIGGQWGGAQGIDDSMFDNPVLYQIDYIRVYQLQ